MAWIYQFLCSENDIYKRQAKGKTWSRGTNSRLPWSDSKYLSNITISELNSDSVVIKRYSISQSFEDSLFAIVIAKTK